jgi:hypothetical protein
LKIENLKNFHFQFSILNSQFPFGTTHSQPSFSAFPLKISAAVAQLVEQLIRNQQVTGSSPVSGSFVKRTPLAVILNGDFFRQRKKRCEESPEE